MKYLLKKLETAIEKSNAAEIIWSNNPESAIAEMKFDAAYNTEYNIRKELAHKIVAVANDIDYNTALKMTYSPKLTEIINRLA